MNDKTQDTQKDLASLIGKFRSAMLVTMTDDGKHISRPMSPLGDDFTGELWFSADRNSNVVCEINAQPHVNVAFMDEGNSNYVSATGTAEQVDDPAKVEELWNPMMKAWFEGKDDPKLTLIKVDVSSAEYWDGPGNLISKAAYMIGSAVTGNHEILSDHETVKNPG